MSTLVSLLLALFFVLTAKLSLQSSDTNADDDNNNKLITINSNSFLSQSAPESAPYAITPISSSIASNSLLLLTTNNNFYYSPSPSPLQFVSIAFVLPHHNLTNTKIREQLRRYLLPVKEVVKEGNQFKRSSASASSYFSTAPITKNTNTDNNKQERSSSSSSQQGQLILPRFQIIPVYTSGVSVSETVRKVFCSGAARGGLNAVFVIIDHKVQNDNECHLSSFVTKLANDMGIPALLWSSAAYQVEDADSNEQGGPPISTKPTLLLAPSMREQALAIAEFLQVHSLRVCSLVVAMETTGAEDFIKILLDTAKQEDLKNNAMRTDVHEEHFKSRISHTVRLPGGRTAAPSKWRTFVRNELMYIRDSTRARVIILWSEAEHANEIFSEARILGMTSEAYLWIGGKPLMGEQVEHHVSSSSSSDSTSSSDSASNPGSGSSKSARNNIVPGTVVVTYDTTFDAQLEVVKAATEIWTRAVRRLAALPGLQNASELAPSDLCAEGKPKPWRFRNHFYKFIEDAKRESIEDFSSIAPAGRMVQFGYLDNSLQWRLLGNWTTAQGFVTNENAYKQWMSIRGAARSIDRSVFLNIVTLEEPPYVIYRNPNPDGKCPDKGVPCELSPFRGAGKHAPLEFEKHDNYTGGLGYDPSSGAQHRMFGNESHSTCCTGLCIDLLQRLSQDIGFKYHIFEVRDRKWGGIDKTTGEWNGLVRALLDEEADLVLTSLKINQERSQAIDFTLPFLETGITIMVAVRPGAISPMALLEPFSPSAWFAILFGCVSAVVLSATLFEKISFQGDLRFWRPVLHPNGREKSNYNNVFQSLWLALAMLFKAAVKVDLPSCFGAKLLTAVWGMFCVIFASSYMANLAVFMITKDDFYDFSGFEDVRNPPYRFGTISSGATEAFIKQNYPSLFDYMRQFNQTSASSGINALKEGKLDAFFYDATVLEYKSSHDPDCQLNVVGKWYAMTGYGIGFPRGSTWLSIFEKNLIDYQYNGFLQRLSEYWLSGACKYRKQAESSNSVQLGLANFTSAFVLLLLGLAVCFIILGVEYVLSKYLVGFIIRRRVKRRQRGQQQQNKSSASLGEESTNNNERSGTSLSKIVNNVSTNARVSQGRRLTRTEGLFAGIFYNAMTARCSNCGGRGHVATVCSSHPDTHLLLASNRANNSKNNNVAPAFGNQQHQHQISNSNADKINYNKIFSKV